MVRPLVLFTALAGFSAFSSLAADESRLIDLQNLSGVRILSSSVACPPLCGR